MIQFIAGLLIGGLITWGITHWYYMLSRRDQQAVFGKLSSELRDMILADKRSNLSVKDLNELLRGTVIDKTSIDPLPYRVCPKCGSENIYRSRDFIVDSDMGDDGMPVHITAPYKMIVCEDCGWRDDEITRDIDRIRE